jgi:hypothetical protein
MLWDNDINPGGISTTFDIKVGGATNVHAALGSFVISENKEGRDPYMGAVQGGIEHRFSDGFKSGIRGTYYNFDNLDSLFIVRGVDGDGGVTDSGGNIPDGLTGDVNGGQLSVIETHLYVKTAIWSLLAFGGYSDNLSAEPSQMFPGVGKESVAYNVGIQGGDKKRSVRLGIAWFHIEANAFPSQFTDSDLLDGRTNREGLLIYGSRQVMKSTDVDVQLFGSNAIETDPAFVDSVKDSERARLQVDLVYKF